MRANPLTESQKTILKRMRDGERLSIGLTKSSLFDRADRVTDVGQSDALRVASLGMVVRVPTYHTVYDLSDAGMVVAATLVEMDRQPMPEPEPVQFVPVAVVTDWR